MSTAAIAVRAFRREDVSDLVALFRAAVREMAARDYSLAQIRAWAPDLIDLGQFAARCAAKSTWVAEFDGRIAGFSDLEPDGHIDMLYVHPQFQRRGVARTLLEHVESVARARGLRQLYTEASLTARPVFRVRGFNETGVQSVTVRGESMTNVRMAKTI